MNSIDELGKDVFLLEYTTNNKLMKRVKTYAKEKEWEVYISNSIELEGD